MREMSRQVGYEVLNTSNDKIIPVDEMDYEDNQTPVIFDDYACEKNQKDLEEILQSTDLGETLKHMRIY